MRLAAALLLISASLLASSACAAPLRFDDIKAQWRNSNAMLLDRHGVTLDEVRLDFQLRRAHWVALSDVSPALQSAIVRAEDQHFWKHEGVDWKAMGAAVIAKIKGAKRGGSTITMQVAGLIEPQLAMQKGGRTLGQKWSQIQAAEEIEQHWSKAQILEAYLNLTTFRGDITGIGAAAEALFGKTPAGLNQGESLLLAALLPSPTAKSGKIVQRACVLAKGSDISCQEITRLAAASLSNSGTGVLQQKARQKNSNSNSPQLAQKLVRKPGDRIVSTLDARLQTFAMQTLRAQLQQLQDQNVRDGAVLVADNETGEVLAYVAGAGDAGSAKYVDAIQAMRQAGSTLKPFLYGLAFEKNYLTAASLLDDSSISISTPVGLYVPQNYDKEFKGWISARTALAGSLNVPAVRTSLLTGVSAFKQQLQDVGYAGLTESADYYGYSLALGSAEVSLWQQVNAYRTLANGGHYGELQLLLGQAPVAAKRKRVMNEAAAFIVSDILADRGARSITFGLENPLATRFWTAVKTGTSKDMRDNWCIGYSRKYTVGVWVGNYSGEAMWDVSGVMGAAPVWYEVMQYLHRESSSTPPVRPAGVSALQISYADEAEPARNELFLRGTEMPVVHPVAAKEVVSHIAYPGRGTIIALDPDIPERQQVVFFEARPAGYDHSWRLDDVQISAMQLENGWLPVAGIHQLALVDSTGKVLDALQFEVRGQYKNK